MKYGLEIEFASPVPRKNFQNIVYISSSWDKPKDRWNLGTDQSANFKGCIGLELRSPIFEEFPFEDLSILLTQFKRHGCITHNRCGLHIHFSEWRGDLRKLTKMVTRMRMPQEARKKYCLRRQNETVRYTPIRCVGRDHYECRIFNSSLKVRAIHQNWKTLVNMLGTTSRMPKC